MDVIGLNHYSAWYSDAGLVDLIPHQVEAEFDAWHEHFGKPMYMSEYGAGAMAGLHAVREITVVNSSEDFLRITFVLCMFTTVFIVTFLNVLTALLRI